MGDILTSLFVYLPLVSQSSGKLKYRYKTVDELKENSSQYQMHSGSSSSAGAGPRKGGASVKVIDMTGPQKRVLSSYEQIHNRHARPDEAAVSSELERS